MTAITKEQIETAIRQHAGDLSIKEQFDLASALNGVYVDRVPDTVDDSLAIAESGVWISGSGDVYVISRNYRLDNFGGINPKDMSVEALTSMGYKKEFPSPFELYQFLMEHTSGALAANGDLKSGQVWLSTDGIWVVTEQRAEEGKRVCVGNSGQEGSFTRDWLEDDGYHLVFNSLQDLGNAVINA